MLNFGTGKRTNKTEDFTRGKDSFVRKIIICWVKDITLKRTPKILSDDRKSNT